MSKQCQEPQAHPARCGCEQGKMESESRAFEDWRNAQVESLRRMGYAEAADAFYNLGSVQWAGWQARAGRQVGVPEGWSVYRDSTGAIYVGVASGRLPGVWLYRDGSADARMLWAYFDEMLTAGASAKVEQAGGDLAVHPKGVQNTSHPALLALDKQCRDDVARALGMTPTAERDFAWSLLLARVKGIKADLAAAPQDYVPLNEALQDACGKLPEGWRIELHIERDGGGVQLYNAQGVEVDFPSDHGRLDYTVNDALEAALAGGEV